MSDRALLFVFGVLVIIVCLGTCATLLMNGQAETVDGLFLILMCGAVVCLPPAIAFAVAGSSGGTGCEKRPDWAAWRKGIEEKTPTTRQRIADQIIACHSLDKHTKRYLKL